MKKLFGAFGYLIATSPRNFRRIGQRSGLVGKKLTPEDVQTFSLVIPYQTYLEASAAIQSSQGLEIAFRDWQEGYRTTEQLLRASIEDAIAVSGLHVKMPAGRPFWGDIPMTASVEDFGKLLNYWYATPGSALAGKEFILEDRRFDR